MTNNEALFWMIVAILVIMIGIPALIQWLTTGQVF